MKHILLLVLFLSGVGAIQTMADDSLPLKEWNNSSQRPLVLYLSGDGGFNKFSEELCTTLHKSGYSIAAINSRSYFWKKKTPQQTAMDIIKFLELQFKKRENKQLILIGYSFGADVMPFIVNRLPAAIKTQLISVSMLSPSTHTDFEVHLSDLMGTSNSKTGMDVLTEINKMGTIKTMTMFGEDENHFPATRIQLKNYANEILAGGHRYDGNVQVVVNTLLKYFK